MRQLALSATLHCLTGCAIGEVLGMVIGIGLGWADAPTSDLSVALAFLFGYALTLRPLLASGLAFAVAARLAFAADTLAIAVMEIVDNAIMLAIPGAMETGPRSVLFWGSLAVALGIAFVALALERDSGGDTPSVTVSTQQEGGRGAPGGAILARGRVW